MAAAEDYQDKHVVVTGAATGVGAALVQRLRDAGTGRVTAIDRKPVGDVDQFFEVDLSDRSAVEDVIKAVDGPVDVLFSNAGVAANLPLEVVLGVNVLAPRALVFGLADKMPAGAAVAATASSAGSQYPARQAEILELLAIDDWAEATEWLRARPELGMDPYTFSKECAQVFTMLASTRLGAQGLRINSVCPGIIETPLLTDFAATLGQPLMDWMVNNSNGRMARPEEIADVLVFLGSSGSAYMNGSNVYADGGFTAALNTGQADFSTLPAM